MAEKPQKPKKVMVCCECGEEDDSWTAYCGRCGRSLHKIVENSQKPKKTIPSSWTKEDLKRQKREEGLFKLGYEQGKREGAKAEREKIWVLWQDTTRETNCTEDALVLFNNRLKAELEK